MSSSEDRGTFYDAVGALRDVVQNHLLQVLALVAMEPPVGPSADDLNDRKAEVFRAMPALNPAHCVRGQYAGYTDIDGVAEGSGTETFVGMRLEIDNWRWSGVPIFLRAGKALPERVTEVRLLLRPTPTLTFLPTRTGVEPNQIVLRVDPDPRLIYGCSWPPRAGIPGGRSTWTRRSPTSSAIRWNPTSGYYGRLWSMITSSSPAKTASSRPGTSCNRCWMTPVSCIPTSLAPGGRHTPSG